MGATLLPAMAFGVLPRYAIGSPGADGKGVSDSCIGRRLVCYRTASRRKKPPTKYPIVCKSRSRIFSSMDDSSDTITDLGDERDVFSSEGSEALGIKEDELIETRKSLSDAQARQKAIEKERDQLLEELARSKAKQQEYVATILHDKELAIKELEAAKSLFHQKLQESVEERFSLESKLVLAKQDAVELAVQVEKFAEAAFQQATSHILEDAQLRVSAAETSAAEAAYQIEKQIKEATEGTILSIVEQSKDAIEKALDVAAKAGDHATKAVSAFADGLDQVDEIVSVQSENIKLNRVVNDLESQLLVLRSEVDRLKLELENAHTQARASEIRASNAEKALLEFQESSSKRTLQKEEEIMSLMEKMRKDASERKKAATKSFKAEVQSIKAAIEAAKEITRSRDNAYLKRCEALQRSLKTSEDASKMWRQRANLAESLLLKESSIDEVDKESVYVVNGGRIDLLSDDDSKKWKLLSDGPRREIPQWRARRIRTIRPKFPPRKVDVAEALTSKFRTLDLPKPDEVWSIAQEKLKEGDTLIEHVIEKETIEKKRKALERALQRKTIQWQRTPEQTKLEPGTGTGREIVFQAFNWESWRRQWYLDLAPKAADLSQSGITAVWLPPPTQSVAPQGYMPSDLYNLNSAYGSEEELKHCIEEMHSQDLLALGDVVLNHRCAHKQSPNGVWNIFGGKLSWGPEAIVCDDPNFQGRGNPSSGDIFHAAPNIDHSQEFVRKDIKEWLNWLRNYIGYDGWRLDFVRGFSGSYVKEYIEASNPAFAIGEYWDSLGYEHGNLCYNQDAHRQRIVNWINATGGTSSAFDVTTKGILHSALHNQYWRLIDPQGKPTRVMGWWPSRAVTFLENHDAGSTQGHWPFPQDKLAQGYAYILTHPGTWSSGAGPLCCSDPPILDPHSGAGHVEKLGGLPTYVIGSPYSKHAAVLISDVYGYEAPNLRKVADKVAAAGFFVAVPDFLKGDPFVRADTKRPMSVWIKDHSTDEGFEFAKVVIQDLKNRGYSAIGAAGFCWGAKAAIQLAKCDSIKAAALLHQSYVTVDDIKEVKVPLAVLGAEFDHPEIVKQFEEVLKGKPEIESFVKIYPGVRHGWTIRYNITDTYTIKKADEAHEDLIQWFSKHVK